MPDPPLPGPVADITDPDIESYCTAHAPEEDALMRRLVTDTRTHTDLPQMQVGRLEGGFLHLLARLTQAERILEVGTFTGYSALAMAAALPDGGELHTCDIDPHATRIAKRHWNDSPHGHKIHLHVGDARETIPRLDGPFDLVFIDADKTGYRTYWDLALPKTRSGGLLVIDNTLWSGTVLDPQDDDARAIATFNDMVHTDDRVDAVLLPVRDGMTLARKR